MDPVSIAAAALSLVPVAGVTLTAYSVHLKRQDEPVEGLNVLTFPSPAVKDGRTSANVAVRVAGAATIYEPMILTWGKTDDVEYLTDDHLPKMNCDTPAMEVRVDYPVDQPGGSPWVGLRWTQPRRRALIEQAARVKLSTGEMQFWTWHTLRNQLRFWARPTGSWSSNKRRPRRQFAVPRDFPDGTPVNH